jgi:hypothetical protein
MNVIIDIADDLAEGLITTAKQNGVNLETYVTRVLGEHIQAVGEGHVQEETVTAEEPEIHVADKKTDEPVKDRPAPLTNDTTTVFGAKKGKEQGAPLYCKKETNSWKIL